MDFQVGIQQCLTDCATGLSVVTDGFDELFTLPQNDVIQDQQSKALGYANLPAGAFLGIY